ncbi:MAG: hypothetical protein KAJ19_19735 [Gammaproteobacteria bacterium]|nr:hypothetical protein [Gammaproteobacteria bacterium]
MSTPTNIIDSKTGQTAKVSRFGQLIVAPIDYSTPIERDLDVIDTAFNFVEPLEGHSIVVTDIIVTGGADVNPITAADVNIYQADAVDSIAPNPTIIRPQVVKSSNFPLTGLNILIPEGKWINAKTSDVTVLLTIACYRVPVERV